MVFWLRLGVGLLFWVEVVCGWVGCVYLLVGSWGYVYGWFVVGVRIRVRDGLWWVLGSGLFLVFGRVRVSVRVSVMCRVRVGWLVGRLGLGLELGLGLVLVLGLVLICFVGVGLVLVMAFGGG